MLNKVMGQVQASVAQGKQLQPEKTEIGITKGPDLAEADVLPKKQPAKEEMEKVVKWINEFLRPPNTHLKFELHDGLQEYHVSVIDDVTGEVVKEIPSKKLLDMHAAMTAELGLLVDKKI